MQLLITNDDGISGPGLRALAVALAGAGHDVVVAAPSRDCSGQGASIGPVHISGQVLYEEVELEGLDAPAFAVDGPPALAVMAGAVGGFGPIPDAVVSGINAGANTGRAVLHSGTVGAVLTAANFGLPGLAVSLAGLGSYHWGSAAHWAVAVLEHAGRLAPPAVLNLNVPDRPLGEILGLRQARLEPGGVVQSAVVERASGGVLELEFRRQGPPAEGSDHALLESGYAALTALRGPSPVEVDLGAVCTLAERVAATRRISA